MSSVTTRLKEIETTAEAIVSHAQEQKIQIERELQEERDRFDKELERDTDRKLADIREEGDSRMEQILKEQHTKNIRILEELEQEFEEKHTVYADEILRHIIEV